jgi:hypothetical protein
MGLFFFADWNRTETIALLLLLTTLAVGSSWTEPVSVGMAPWTVDVVIGRYEVSRRESRPER